jgi:hypothetical protein
MPLNKLGRDGRCCLGEPPRFFAQLIQSCDRIDLRRLRLVIVAQ